MFPILHCPAEDPDRAEERARIMAPPPILVVLSKRPQAIVTSLADFQAKFPDAPRDSVAQIRAYYLENQGAVHVMTAQ
jgi:hypothetical protein